MVPYYGRHGCKQYIQNKPVKFGYKLWVAATPLGYGIQFYPYARKDDNYNKDIGLGGFVVMTLTLKLPTVPDSHYHVVMGNFFTSPILLLLLVQYELDVISDKKSQMLSATRNLM